MVGDGEDLLPPVVGSLTMLHREVHVVVDDDKREFVVSERVEAIEEKTDLLAAFFFVICPTRGAALSRKNVSKSSGVALG